MAVPALGIFVTANGLPDRKTLATANYFLRLNAKIFLHIVMYKIYRLMCDRNLIVFFIFKVTIKKGNEKKLLICAFQVCRKKSEKDSTKFYVNSALPFTYYAWL